MAITNFQIRPEELTPLEQELLIRAGASIDYETAADRTQRGLIVADRAATSSVTQKEITRGFKLDVTQVDETVQWVRDLPVITLNVPADLSAVEDTLEFEFYAQDPEGNVFDVVLGTVPSGITAVFGVDDDSLDLTITYPAQTSNPSSNLSFAIPVYLQQNNVKVAGSDRTLMVRVLRYSPQPLHSAYPSPVLFGRMYINATEDHTEHTLSDYIRNPSGRPLRMGRGTSFAHSWSDPNASYQITESNGIFSFRADRVSPFPFGDPRTSNVIIRVSTNDAGDTSTVFLHFLLRVAPPSS